jgi:hypothetical protein
MTMAPDRYPRATWRETPNFWPGHSGRRAVVIHIMEGEYLESISYMKSHGVSAHFAVSRRGACSQLVSVNNSAWGNGLSWNEERVGWECPHDHIVRPTWELLQVPTNPNLQTISIEHEGKSGDPWPALMISTTVDTLQWLGKQFPSLLPYRVGSTLIGHRHIDPTDKARCPGTGIDLLSLATKANAAFGAPVASNEPWVATWASRGNPLPADQAAWAIPQLYKYHASELGGCLAPERYLVPGAFSIAVFERGSIYYLAKTQKAYLGSRFPIDI